MHESPRDVGEHSHGEPWDDESEKLYELGLISAVQAAIKSGLRPFRRQDWRPQWDDETPAQPVEPSPQPPKRPKSKSRWAKWGGRPPSKRELMMADKRPDLKPPLPNLSEELARERAREAAAGTDANAPDPMAE